MPGSQAVPQTIARLMAAFRQGDKDAANQLIELLYPELRRLAAAKMKDERAQHTWQPTVLVNELYLALVKTKALGNGSESAAGHEKAAFLALAGQIMRHLLIDHSRPLYRRAEKVTLEEGPHLAASGAESLRSVEEALSRLEAIDPKFRAVTELRVFEGLTTEEIATQLGCSTRTVATYWSFAKRWLAKEFSGAADS